MPGTTCTPEMLKGLGLDVLVLSVGSLFGPEQGSGHLRPDEIIMGSKRPGKRVLIAGGDGVGLAIAVPVTGEHDITIIEESGRLGRDVSPFYLWRYLKLFRERGVDVLTRTVLKGWEKRARPQSPPPKETGWSKSTTSSSHRGSPVLRWARHLHPQPQRSFS